MNHKLGIFPHWLAVSTLQQPFFAWIHARCIYIWVFASLVMSIIPCIDQRRNIHFLIVLASSSMGVLSRYITLTAVLVVALLLLLLVAVPPPCEAATDRLSSIFGSAVDNEGEGENSGTKWAVLVAGSNGYSNYRHQVNG